MPRDVAVVLPGRRAATSEIATAITIARSLISSGRHVSFYRGYDALADLAKRDEAGRWTRGIILVGPLAEAVGVVDSPVAKVAGRSSVVRHACRRSGRRVAGAGGFRRESSCSAGRLFASPLLAVTRGIPAATGRAKPRRPMLPTDRVTFDQLAVAPAQAEVYGRADLVAVIDTRRLPGGTRPTRLLLDLMVAPDGAGDEGGGQRFRQRAAARQHGRRDRRSDPSRSCLAGWTCRHDRQCARRHRARQRPGRLPVRAAGLSGATPRIIVARACDADGAAHDFSDLPPRFAHGLELLLPAPPPISPMLVLGLVAEVVSQLSPDVTPLAVNFVAPAARRRRTSLSLPSATCRPRAPLRACASIAGAWP